MLVPFIFLSVLTLYPACIISHCSRYRPFAQGVSLDLNESAHDIPTVLRASVSLIA